MANALLSTLLSDLFKQVKIYQDFLMQEQQAFIQNDHALIATITEQKNQAAEQLEKLDKQRQQFWQSLNIADSEQAFIDFINRLPSNEKASIEPLWQNLKDALNQCAELNEVNGAVAGVNLHNTRRLLELMKGRDIKDDIYGPKGTLTSQQTSKHQSDA